MPTVDESNRWIDPALRSTARAMCFVSGGFRGNNGPVQADPVSPVQADPIFPDPIFPELCASSPGDSGEVMTGFRLTCFSKSFSNLSYSFRNQGDSRRDFLCRHDGVSVVKDDTVRRSA